jgi:hypothetical protein
VYHCCEIAYYIVKLLREMSVSVDVKNLLKATVGIGDGGEVNMWDLLSSGFLFFFLSTFSSPRVFLPNIG